jgi:hypothetical protein
MLVFISGSFLCIYALWASVSSLSLGVGRKGKVGGLGYSTFFPTLSEVKIVILFWKLYFCALFPNSSLETVARLRMMFERLDVFSPTP